MGRTSLALVLMLATARIARADPVPVDGPFEDLSPKPAPVHLSHVKWYGWQIMAADLPLLAFFATWPAWQFDGTAPLIIDAVAITLVGPIVHGVHDDAPGGAASFGIRLGFLGAGTLGGALGDFGCAFSMGRCSSPKQGFDTWAGALGASAFASLMDSLALAWETTQGRSVSWGVAPTFLRGGAGLSLRVGY